MGSALALRSDFDGVTLRHLARRTKGANQARRFLALAEVYDGAARSQAAKVGSVTVQIVRDLVVRFNECGPADKACIEALVRNGVVHIMGCENRWIRLARKYGVPEDYIRVNVTTDNSSSAIELTRTGFGPCLVQSYYAQPAIESGELVAPICDGVDIEEGQYVLTPRSAQGKNPAAMLFRKWLLEEAGTYNATT